MTIDEIVSLNDVDMHEDMAVIIDRLIKASPLTKDSRKYKSNRINELEEIRELLSTQIKLANLLIREELMEDLGIDKL